MPIRCKQFGCVAGGKGHGRPGRPDGLADGETGWQGNWRARRTSGWDDWWMGWLAGWIVMAGGLDCSDRRVGL